VGVSHWFRDLRDRDPLFHPDDDPASIIRIDNGSRTFAKAEVTALRELLAAMFARHGIAVHDAALPVFMDAMEGAGDHQPVIHG
jgi:hypothetical protein